MNKINLLSTILLFSIILISQVYALPPTAYGIWRNDTTNTASFGIVSLNTATATQRFTLIGDTFTINNMTGSSYNPATGLITAITQNIGDQEFYMTTVDTNTWTLFNHSLIVSPMNFANLQFDATTDTYNLFATYTTGDGNIYVSKLSTTESHYKTIDIIYNAYPNATAAYISSSQIYKVCYLNATGQMCNSYNLNNEKTNSVQYGITNLNSAFHTTSSSYSMVYLPKQDALMSNMNIAQYYPLAGKPQLFYLYNSNYYNTGWYTNGLMSNVVSAYASFGDISLPRVYQFCQTYFSSNPNVKYSLYMFSTYNNAWSTTTTANAGVINAWSFQ